MPKTWAKYEAGIYQFYQVHQVFTSVLDYTNHSFPTSAEYEKFYPIYLEHFKPFTEEEQYKKYFVANHVPSTDENVFLEELDKTLKLWLSRLEWVWNQKKNFEPYKKTWLNMQNK